MDLEEFFLSHDKVAIAFSGGVDSAYLLYEAVKAGVDVRPYYVKSQFQPQFELDDAFLLCSKLGVELSVLDLDILSFPAVKENCKKRCYFCKKQIMSTIKKRAKEDGYAVILDGSNASDSSSERPGMKALEEEEILSPLRLAGLDKSEIRRRSKNAGLFTWNKAAYACLATRIPTGVEIDKEMLDMTEKAESYLYSLGLRDFRVRYLAGCARLQIQQSDLPLILDNRESILEYLSKYYASVVLDLEWRG